MSTAELVLVALAIAVGLVGIIVPILPGALLVLAAIAVWAFVDHTTTAWVTLGIAVLLIGASTVIKYTWPMRRMRDAEISKKTLAIGAVLGIIGFFVVPIVGLVLGFVLGVYIAELAARGDARRAWVSTVHALKGVALSVGIELVGALGATVAWAVAVLT
jgi:uncharacterized protein YqgC (DUF456 family)